MTRFVYDLPVRIVFGTGAGTNIAEETAHLGKRCFVIADAFFQNDSTFLDYYEAGKSLFCGRWTGVVPNPTIQSVREAAAAVAEAQADFVLAIGGGSALDTAKAACLSAKTGVDIDRYHTGSVPMGSESLPMAALPTTAGTGSEVTPFSVLSNHETGFKGPIAGRALLPRLALVDPAWTLTAPPAVTAAAGMDALSHALEAYWSKGAFPICDAYAEKAVVLVMSNLARAYRDGSDLDARSNMALAALLAGMAFGHPKNAAVHACSFPLTGKYGLPHGTACAFTLDLFLKCNAQAMPEKLTYLSTLAGYRSVEEFAAAIHDLKAAMGMPTTLREAGIDVEALDELVEASFHPLMNNNPMTVSKEALTSLYRSISEE